MAVEDLQSKILSKPEITQSTFSLPNQKRIEDILLQVGVDKGNTEEAFSAFSELLLKKVAEKVDNKQYTKDNVTHALIVDLSLDERVDFNISNIKLPYIKHHDNQRKFRFFDYKQGIRRLLSGYLKNENWDLQRLLTFAVVIQQSLFKKDNFGRLMLAKNTLDNESINHLKRLADKQLDYSYRDLKAIAETIAGRVDDYNVIQLTDNVMVWASNVNDYSQVDLKFSDFSIYDLLYFLNNRKWFNYSLPYERNLNVENAFNELIDYLNNPQIKAELGTDRISFQLETQAK